MYMLDTNIVSQMVRGHSQVLRRVQQVPMSELCMSAITGLQRTGTTLGPLDTLIAAHALQTQCILVTHDAAFVRVDGLAVEDWTQ